MYLYNWAFTWEKLVKWHYICTTRNLNLTLLSILCPSRRSWGFEISQSSGKVGLRVELGLVWLKMREKWYILHIWYINLTILGLCKNFCWYFVANSGTYIWFLYIHWSWWNTNCLWDLSLILQAQILTDLKVTLQGWIVAIIDQNQAYY